MRMLLLLLLSPADPQESVLLLRLFFCPAEAGIRVMLLPGAPTSAVPILLLLLLRPTCPPASVLLLLLLLLAP